VSFDSKVSDGGTTKTTIQVILEFKVRCPLLKRQTVKSTERWKFLCTNESSQVPESTSQSNVNDSLALKPPQTQAQKVPLSTQFQTPSKLDTYKLAFNKYLHPLTN